jgi:predicted alpha/beta-hydrolase family hydrolase
MGKTGGGRMNEETFQLNDTGFSALLLWLRHVAPSKAPNHTQKALAWLYKDFNAARFGIGFMFQVPTCDCKTPDQLRQRARDAMAKLDELSSNGTPTEVAAVRYEAWAKSVAA